MAGPSSRLLCWALPAVVLASLVAGTSAKLWWTWPRTPTFNDCPAPPARFITANTCKYANGAMCDQCWGKCCLRDGNCVSNECNKVGFTYDNICRNPFDHSYWSWHTGNCIGNTNYKCTSSFFKTFKKLEALGTEEAEKEVEKMFFFGKGKGKGKGKVISSCPQAIAMGSGTCEPVNPTCPQQSKYCLGKVRCNHYNCGSWNGATCILETGHQWTSNRNFHVCACDGGVIDAPPPPPPGEGPGVGRSPPRPRNPTAPKEPKAPKEPRAPRAPRAPKEPAMPEYPPNPDAPRRPRRPRSPPPVGVPDAPVRSRPPPPPVPSTCPKVNIPVTNQCRRAGGGYCSRCLGKCCLDDGYCPSSKCNDAHWDATTCNFNSGHHSFWHSWKNDRSSCLGTFGFTCYSFFKNTCPAVIQQNQGLCVPINANCGSQSWNKWGKWGKKFTFGKWDKWGKWGKWGKHGQSWDVGQGCLGTINCPNGGCADWHGAPCIYEGFNKLNKLNLCASDFEICSCPLQNPIG